MKVSNNRTGQPPLQKGAGACKAGDGGFTLRVKPGSPAPRPDQPSDNAPLHLPHTASNNASYPKATHTHHHTETVSPETLKPKRSKLVDTAPPHRQTPASGVQNLQIAAPPPSFRWNIFSFAPSPDGGRRKLLRREGGEYKTHSGNKPADYLRF